MESKKWFTKTLEEVQSECNQQSGLSEQEVLASREKNGINKLDEGKKRSLFSMFIDQFKDVMIIVLIVAAGLSYFAPMVLKREPGHLEDALVILTIVVLNAIVGVVQEGRAENALKALQEMSSPNAKVIRNGNEQIIPSTDIVVGDIVVMEAGDLVPADIRLLASSSLKVQEASLTGESVPVEKHAEAIVKEDAVLGDRVNMVYSSGTITYGRGSGVVVEVGMHSEVGKIASLLKSAGETQTPLQQQLNTLGKQLGVLSIIACVIVFMAGLLYNNDPVEMFLTAVSLAVAVIPEGLPAVSTVVLAMGVQRLVKKHAIIRNLPSVETLGGATVICSDKTGTLTQNKMTVVEYWNDQNEDKANDIALASLLCNDARLIDGVWVGDPTETALSEWASKIGIDTQKELDTNKRVNEVPFDSGRKRMTTINEIDGELVVFCKGGVDEILAVSTHYGVDGKAIVLNDKHKVRIQEANEEMAKKALRVLAIAKKTIKKNYANGDASAEADLTFIGLIGMIDPPRPEVIEAIATCKKSGIRTVMITGDHAATAAAIAREIGMLDEKLHVVTGKDLDTMSDDDLFNEVKNIGVYARVSPEDKMRIIDAWKKHGEIVAMTGDGVNDAPALKKADIGAAMGVVGTEVAKGAADMILTDDNFATIVSAVGEGRRIKDNIKKAVQYLLSCNIGELLTLLIATLLDHGTPLLAIHILWVNLVTDSFPALALGIDPEEEGIMKRQPDRSNSLITKSMMWRIFYQGIMVGGLTLFAYYLGSNQITFLSHGEPIDISQGQTMAFCVLAFSQLIHAYNIHSSRKSVFTSFMKNKWLIIATVVNAIMMLAVLFVPALQDVFNLVPLDLEHWEVVIGLILLPIPIVEIMKLLKLNGID
ncbi:MAG: calcium-translocating P-type ATPase, PMCA-type [Breznakia sp.]